MPLNRSGLAARIERIPDGERGSWIKSFSVLHRAARPGQLCLPACLIYEFVVGLASERRDSGYCFFRDELDYRLRLGGVGEG